MPPPVREAEHSGLRGKQGPRAPVAERAAGAVAEVTIAGGASFMASRWRSQAWPALASLLAGRPIPPP